MKTSHKPSIQLIEKYNLPVPRYTSYPTVPFWKDGIDVARWKRLFAKKFLENNSQHGISLYIHLPFCESLCTYCGCNKKITTNHSVEEQYLAALKKEWELYLELMDEVPVIREIHLGGGTPTFFSPANLRWLVNLLVDTCILHAEYEFSFEGHPNNTTAEHLETLYSLGFTRVSYGVQDLDPEVQRIINRIQPFERVLDATENARRIGYKSVNFDLIYGLPKQTMQSIEATIAAVTSLRPDRIAFYSYAHVPWTSRGQRLFSEEDLPTATEKIALYLRGKELLSEAGYEDIGMDHFALREDDLFAAMEEGRLRRSFMGYTAQHSPFLLGLGVSSISDIGAAFAQNKKALHEYYEMINAGELAVTKGYFCYSTDIAFREYIIDIACQQQTKFNPAHLPVLREYSFPPLQQLKDDGLILFDENGLTVTEAGTYFLRNICSCFDLYLQASKATSPERMFSKAI